MKKLITALLCVCILLGVYGCAAKPATEDPAAQAKPTQTEQTPAADAQTPETSVQDETVDPFGGYDTPITLTTIVAQTLTTSCPEGVTLDDNPWKTLWNSKGIDVQYTSVAADFEDMPTKINLAITAGEFPDFASVSYATYTELLEADMLTDMTDIFEQYASDDLKKLMYADGGVMASNVTKDGRLYGLVQPADYLDKGGVVAIRTDWLQELGLSEPKSMTDVWDIAAAFKENNMGGTCTIGLGATKEISDMLAMKYLINAEGGLVSTWLEQDGELVYSLIQPEMKTALSALHDKYASGLLDQEYGTKSEQQLFEDAVSGKSGVVICNMTAPFYLDNGISLGQEWGYYPLYNEDGGFAPVEVSTSIGSVVVVSKDCKNPEAVVKLFNMFIKYTNEESQTYSESGINNLSYPAIITATGVNHEIYIAYTHFIDTNEEPAEFISNYAGTVETCEKWRLENDESGRILYTIFGPDSTQGALDAEINGGAYLISAFTGTPGEAFTKNGGNLNTLANQMITNIITGAQPVDYFDEFVNLWKSSGGDAITAEINEWYQNR